MTPHVSHAELRGEKVLIICLVNMVHIKVLEECADAVSIFLRLRRQYVYSHNCNNFRFCI